MMEPHPESRVPIYCGGHSDVAIKRAARYCDGWIGRAYAWDEAVHYVAKLKQFLGEYGREHGPFEIIIGLYGVPGVDLYRRAEETLGVTGMLCMPWARMEHPGAEHPGAEQNGPGRPGRGESAERYRTAINRFAEQIVSRC